MPKYQKNYIKHALVLRKWLLLVNLLILLVCMCICVIIFAQPDYVLGECLFEVRSTQVIFDVAMSIFGFITVYTRYKTRNLAVQK